tara:strand:- start:20 stop:592 length:573 start_codon:yes stop_codon:yes gene_type:complete
MTLNNSLETLKNVRDNISENLADGVKNRKSDFRTFTLCTAGDMPSGRTVVLRGYDSSSGIITLHTNYQAKKIIQIENNANVCCVFYSKKLKLQYRCFGDAIINHANNKTKEAWNKMGDISKECYFQNPLPDTEINNFDDFSKDIINKQSDFFAVVNINIIRIDWLYLKREGHRRANIFINTPQDDVWVAP